MGIGGNMILFHRHLWDDWKWIVGELYAYRCCFSCGKVDFRFKIFVKEKHADREKLEDRI